MERRKRRKDAKRMEETQLEKTIKQCGKELMNGERKSERNVLRKKVM